MSGLNGSCQISIRIWTQLHHAVHTVPVMLHHLLAGHFLSWWINQHRPGFTLWCSTVCVFITSMMLSLDLTVSRLLVNTLHLILSYRPTGCYLHFGVNVVTVLYYRGNKKVFSQPPIVQVLPLKKMRPVIFIIGTLQIWQTK